MRPVDVRELIGRPGAVRTVSVAEPVDDLKTGLASMPGDVGAELEIEGQEDGVLVRGTLRGSMTLTCARCLKTFDNDFRAEVSEGFVLYASDDEYGVAASGELDLEPLVRDAVILAMPFSPLCRPDCKGLCARCGGDRNLGECTCPEEDRDPRWAALDQLID